MALAAIIFDLDGTLIDTNHAHVQAWDLALKKHNYRVSNDRIAVEIGKGGDKLVPSILGHDVDQKDGNSLRKAHGQEFTKIARAEQLKLFPGVDELFRKIRNRGLKLALATSSSKTDLQTTLESAGINWDDAFDVVATSEDASGSKPDPGILSAAVAKLKLSPAQCVMVGDTPYDADTARDAGVVCLGLTCGKMNDEKTLRATGMRQVYRDPLDLADQFDNALAIASPGSAMLDQYLLESLMDKALAVARLGLETGEVPIGCVIADGTGSVIARAHNELNRSQVKTAHAEMVCFARTAGKVDTNARDLILVSTLEPCVMCLGAAMEASVDTIVFGLPAPTDGGRLRVRPPVSPESQMPRIVGKILEEKSRALLEEFLNSKPSNPSQVTFVRDLLGKT